MPTSSSQVIAAVVGPESMENLRLSTDLRKALGPENVFRHLETEHMLDFLSGHADVPTVVFVDLFSFDLARVTSAIGQARDRFPRVVFATYVDRSAWRTRRAELPGEWSSRLEHYYGLSHASGDEELEPIVREVLFSAANEALYNFDHEPIRLTERFSDGVLPPRGAGGASPPDEATVFVSYSRSDWQGAVCGIIDRLREFGHQVWVDQNFLVGGSDWMDAIGEALKKCGSCVLALSPEALGSKYVKMEYHYFWHNDKPIVPVMVKPVNEIPPVLMDVQYIDFTTSGVSPPWDALRQAVARAAGTSAGRG